MYRVSQSLSRYREQTDGPIQHALSAQGEYLIPGSRYKVDGYRPGVCYEFNGCLYHGCPKCITQRNTTLPKTQETAEVLYQKTLNKQRFLWDKGYKVVTIWEHEYDANPPPISAPVVERLNPRDSFFGGRTNATRLHCKAEPGQCIQYADFTSLYPSVNKARLRNIT